MSILLHIFALIAASLPKPGLLALLVVVCFAVLLALPTAARKGVLHVPGYIGLAMFAFVIAMVSGRLAGVQKITGSFLGVCLSILFFLLISVSLGSVLAIFFFRPPPET